MASIRKHNDKWRGRVYLHRGPGGIRTKVLNHPHTKDGERKARLELAKWEDELKQGEQRRRRATGSGATVLDILDRWYTRMVSTEQWASVRTAERNRREIDHRIAGSDLAGMVAADVTVSDINDFNDALAAQTAKRGVNAGQQLSVGTRKITHGVLTAAFGYAASQAWLEKNPMQHATPPTGPEKDIQIPTDEQVAIIFAAAEGPLWEAYVRLAFTVGMRRSNILGIQWRDVDMMTQSTLKVMRAVTYAKSTVQVKRPKSGRQWSVTLDAGTNAALDDLLESRNETARQIGVSVAGIDYVFCDRPKDGYDIDFMSRPMHPAAVSTWWGKVRKNNPELKGVSLHSWRHYAASQMYAQGLDDVTIANRLGHKNPNTTRSIYAHLIPARDQDAAETMAAIVPPRKENNQ